MEWHNHFYDIPEGSHAFLGASKYSWLNYNPEKLVQVYKNHLAVERGTRIHELAAEHIRLNITMPTRPKNTLNMYINDAISYQMRPEQHLYYSENCYGTADAICFNRNKLRIHDLKTGTTPASLHQLEIYASLFCLEYSIKPGDIKIELRIYQNNDILIGEPKAENILPIMDWIVQADKIINEIKEQEGV